MPESRVRPPEGVGHDVKGEMFGGGPAPSKPDDDNVEPSEKDSTLAQARSLAGESRLLHLRRGVRCRLSAQIKTVKACTELWLVRTFRPEGPVPGVVLLMLWLFLRWRVPATTSPPPPLRTAGQWSDPGTDTGDTWKHSRDRALLLHEIERPCLVVLGAPWSSGNNRHSELSLLRLVPGFSEPTAKGRPRSQACGEVSSRSVFPKNRNVSVSVPPEVSSTPCLEGLPGSPTGPRWRRALFSQPRLKVLDSSFMHPGPTPAKEARNRQPQACGRL